MHILVALDGSSHADAVTAVAIQLAKAHQPCTVTALHIVNVRMASGNLLADLPGHLGFEPAIVSAEVESEHLANAKAIVGAFKKAADVEGVEVIEEVRAGAVPAILAEMAADADLLVMGFRGETEDRYPGQGGRLAANLPMDNTPIMLVPKGLRGIHKVVVGYDGSTGAIHAVRTTRSVLMQLSPELHGVYVGEDGTAVLDELQQRVGHPVERHVVTGNPHEVLLRLAKTLPADVVVLGFSGHSKLKDFVFGTLGEEALLDGSTAVLLST